MKTTIKFLTTNCRMVSRSRFFSILCAGVLARWPLSVAYRRISLFAATENKAGGALAPVVAVNFLIGEKNAFPSPIRKFTATTTAMRSPISLQSQPKMKCAGIILYLCQRTESEYIYVEHHLHGNGIEAVWREKGRKAYSGPLHSVS